MDTEKVEGAVQEIAGEVQGAAAALVGDSAAPLAGKGQGTLRQGAAAVRRRHQRGARGNSHQSVYDAGSGCRRELCCRRHMARWRAQARRSVNWPRTSSRSGAQLPITRQWLHLAVSERWACRKQMAVRTT